MALFDILGFEQRFRTRGLADMYSAYTALISDIDSRNEHMDRLFHDMEFHEAPYWTSDGEVFVFNRVQGAYASDSILLWADRTWEEARSMSSRALCATSFESGLAWIAYPIPSDNFLDACNELLCRSIETDLPVRGAISVGPAILDAKNRVFLGQPLIDVARMERGQRFIGASLCRAPMELPFKIPSRYLLSFDEHLKEKEQKEWGGVVLDWPRHWRRTRKDDLGTVIRKLNTEGRYSGYYETTIQMVEKSEKRVEAHEERSEQTIRAQYHEFSRKNQHLRVHARAVRRVPIAKENR